MNISLYAFVDELEKISALKGNVKLRPHQEEAAQAAEESGGRLIFAHGTGIGKTLASIATNERMRERGDVGKTLVLTPASLKTNFVEQGVRKFTDSSVGPVGSGADYQVLSLETFRNDPKAYLELSGADSAIVDEIHRAKNPGTKTYEALKDISPELRSLLGLTGSVISNHPRDLVPLMDIVQPEHSLGSQQAFSKTHVKRKQVGKGGLFRPPRFRASLHQAEKLRGKVQGRVHYVDQSVLGKSMPALEQEDVHVPMSEEQNKLYGFALGKLTPSQRRKIRQGLPVNQTEAQHVFSMLTRARQASNSVGTHRADLTPAQSAEATPKLKRVMDDVEEHLRATDDGQAVVFSNLVDGGAQELHDGLRARGVQTGLYSGRNKADRQKDVDDFNAGKLKAIVLTPAGGEGLSLNNATFFAEVDRHFNPERNQQAIARGRRLGGQSHRPESERKLEVKRYFSVPKPSFFEKLIGGRIHGVDDWIDAVATEKTILNEELRQALKEGK